VLRPKGRGIKPKGNKKGDINLFIKLKGKRKKEMIDIEISLEDTYQFLLFEGQK